MSSCIDIHVPHETVNDDFVTIVEWHVESGREVSAGQTVVSIETSKMVMDVEAEADGYLEVLQPTSAEIAVGDLIGRIHSEQEAAQSGNSSPSKAEATSSSAPAADTAAVAPEGTKISKKAQALITQYEVDPAVFAGRGLVKEADVIAHLEAQKESQQGRAEDSPEPRSADVSASGATSAASKYRGGLFADAKASAKDRGQSVFVLGLNYVFRNWLLGNLVRWAPRGVILVLHRWRGVRMGEGCFIDPSSIVETAYPENVSLGDDVRITAGAIIMTHIKAPHYLRDTGIMPAVVKPVVLEDHSFIGVNSVIMPGVTVGKAAVVASGAVVNNNVPPYTMVAGNPAKVIKTFPQPDTTGQKS